MRKVRLIGTRRTQPKLYVARNNSLPLVTWATPRPEQRTETREGVRWSWWLLVAVAVLACVLVVVCVALVGY